MFKRHPYIFKPIYTHKGTFDYKKHPVNLTGYVYDYLVLKEENKHKKIEPPLDCVWNMCRGYSEDGVTFWVCMMIISSCYQICDNYLNTRPEDFKEDDVRYISLGDHVSLIDTQEDVYLYALLELYINLYNEK